MSHMASAWLEISEQILGGFYALDNATPDWLVDGETGRRLKVHRLYPELGLALRFKGSLRAARSAYLDELELLEEAVRDTLRARLCHRAGIALVVIDAESDAPGDTLSQLHTALSAAARRIAQREVAKEAKLSLLPRVASAKETCQRIMAQVSSPEDLMPFVEAWEDRQFGQEESNAAVNYWPGMSVTHAGYGKGLVLHVTPEKENDDPQIVVQFSDGTVHAFSPDQASQALDAGEQAGE